MKPAVPAVAHVRRPRLLRALIRREVNGMSAVLVLLSAMLGVVAARRAHAFQPETPIPPLVDGLLQRFDLTMLFVMVLLLTLRTAARIEADHLSGWLGPAFTAGASRPAYAAAIAVAAFIAPASAFVSSAVAFAFGVHAFAGTPELATVLHRTVGAGLLVLGTYAVCAAAIGTAVRRAMPTVFLIVALLLVPLVLGTRYLIAAEPFPLWLSAVSLVSPLLIPPGDSVNALRAVLYIAIGGGLLAGISHRYAGRHQ